MTFKEFSRKVKEDTRLTNLIDRYSDRNDSVTDEEIHEMVNRAMTIMDDEEEIEKESPVDLYGPWWE